MKRLLPALACLCLLLAAAPSRAANLDGVELPEQRTLAGTVLHLNGFGLRTASVFQIHVYVAGLFLEQPSTNAEAILNSPRPKLLELHFLYDLTADATRKAWDEAFERTCHGPCEAVRGDIAAFLAQVPGVHRGDVAQCIFAPEGLHVLLNGHEIGTAPNGQFSRLVLATFLGHAPASRQLKQDLLGTSRPRPNGR